MKLIPWLFRMLGAKPDPAFAHAVAELEASPSARAPITARELVMALQAIARREPTTKEELAQIEAESYVLGERIKLTPALHNVPHDLWHFLSDADIRFKDPRYRKAQLEGMERWLKEV
jgi:hypothetical protein